MSMVVLTETYTSPPVNQREILRYAACRQADSEVYALLEECTAQAEQGLVYRVCWCEIPVTIDRDNCDFGFFSASSNTLARGLKGCNRAVLFAATVGVGIDRLITKYSRISPSKALIFQALGAERIESLCDKYCADMQIRFGSPLRPRISPGYGDIPLELQRDIFSMLDCGKKIGLTLNESLLMSPSKSVTAFAGIASDGRITSNNRCASCGMQNCAFGGAK